jgi:chitinase
MKTLLLSFCLTALLAAPAAHARKKVVAYVPNWVNLEEFSKGIDYSKLTHINIAFENPVDDEGDLSFNKRNTALMERAKAAKVKVLVSIGGGAASGDAELKPRYFKLLSDAYRPAFVKKLADYVVERGFDGLDVDIEGPSINEDYGKFIADLSAALKPKGKLLTAALSKGYGGDKVPDSALGYFDFLNIMAYDGAGFWNPDAPGQHSSLEFAKGSAKYWVGRGLPKSKAVLGVPFYGYGFGEAFRKRCYNYSEILAKHPGSENLDQVGNTIWYNGIPTIREKARHVVDEDLGGIMIWSLDTDGNGEKSLLGAIDAALNSEEKK